MEMNSLVRDMRPEGVEGGKKDRDIEREDDDLWKAREIEPDEGGCGGTDLGVDEIRAVVGKVDNEPDGDKPHETEREGGEETPDDVAIKRVLARV